VILDGQEARLRPRELELAGVLLLYAGQPCSRDMLTGALWPGTPPAHPVNALNVCVSRARRALGDRNFIVTLDGAYQASPPPGSLDLDRYFRHRGEAARAAGRGDLRDAGRALRQAMRCWGARPFDGLPPAPGIRAEAGRLLAQQRVDRLVMADICLALGLHEQALPRLHAEVIASPASERSWELLVLALSRCGRHPEALAAWSRAREALGSPGSRLRAMLDALLSGRPLPGALSPGQIATALGAAPPGSTHPGGRGITAFPCAQPAPGC
jgi:DNA-binding SARP family transcriptional activator